MTVRRRIGRIYRTAKTRTGYRLQLKGALNEYVLTVKN
jgi:hypothetical protein